MARYEGALGLRDAVGLVLAVGAPRSAETTEAGKGSAEELVFLLQYIGVDYGTAVRDGRIVHAPEYAEMLQFVPRRRNAMPVCGPVSPPPRRCRRRFRT
jgi:hypothetical protein